MSKIEKYLFSFIIVVASIVIFIVGLTGNSKKYDEVNKVVDTIINSKETNLVYIYPSNCIDCENQSYQMKFLIKEYGLKYYNISLEGISYNKRQEIFKKLKIEDNENRLTIAIYKDKELKEYLYGMTDTKSLFDMLKKYNLVSKKELPINYLTITNYVDKISDDILALQIGSSTDPNSSKMEELLWNIAIKYNKKLDFIDLSDLTNVEGELFESKIDNFNDENIVVPSLIILKKGHIIDKILGIGQQEQYIELLKKYGIIE